VAVSTIEVAVVMAAIVAVSVAVVAAVSTVAQGKCIKLSAQNAIKNAKSLSSQQKASQCTAETVSRSTGVDHYLEKLKKALFILLFFYLILLSSSFIFFLWFEYDFLCISND